MDFYNQTAQTGGRVFRELTAQGIGFEITPDNKLRITSKITKKQFELVRLWKAQIINELSPKCSNCTLSMELIENGTLWFCPLGCESQIKA